MRPMLSLTRGNARSVMTRGLVVRFLSACNEWRSVMRIMRASLRGHSATSQVTVQSMKLQLLGCAGTTQRAQFSMRGHSCMISLQRLLQQTSCARCIHPSTRSARGPQVARTSADLSFCASTPMPWATRTVLFLITGMPSNQPMVCRAGLFGNGLIMVCAEPIAVGQPCMALMGR
ncbi:unannotated protein [freshwater metagenome]|uniref:Unannotated protein n=1 Tax=freshwater metagenome TaxID=449393 RepID=A0A6J6BQ12_9ZZZZ